LADTYFQIGNEANKKKDSVSALKNLINAKKYSDEFFAKKKSDDITLYDYQLRADILNKTSGTADEIFNTYIQGAAIDTLANLKVDLLKKGIAYFKEKKIREKEILLIQKLIELKPKPSINDYFDLTLANYMGGKYANSRIEAIKMIEKFPDQVYGYEWAYNSAIAIDTVKKDSIAVPDALKLYGFTQKDTAKFRKQYLSSVKYLVGYYVNTVKDKDKSLEFLGKWLAVDPANATTITGYMDQIKKAPPAKQSSAPLPKGSPAASTGSNAKSAPALPAKPVKNPQ
jgi:tetratricopeptide (TPR) repeat protein